MCDSTRSERVCQPCEDEPWPLVAEIEQEVPPVWTTSSAGTALLRGEASCGSQKQVSVPHVPLETAVCAIGVFER